MNYDFAGFRSSHAFTNMCAYSYVIKQKTYKNDEVQKYIDLFTSATSSCLSITLQETS